MIPQYDEILIFRKRGIFMNKRIAKFEFGMIPRNLGATPVTAQTASSGFGLTYLLWV